MRAATNAWAGDPGELVYGLDLSRFADGDGDGFGDFAGAIEHRTSTTSPPWA